MNRLLIAMCQYLDKNQFPYALNKDDTLSLHIKDDKTMYNGFIKADDDRLYMYLELPYTIPENFKAKVCEYICRANDGLPYSLIEMEYDYGEVHCKTELQWYDIASPTTDFLRAIILICLDITTNYTAGIKNILENHMDPEEAIYNVEANLSKAFWRKDELKSDSRRDNLYMLEKKCDNGIYQCYTTSLQNVLSYICVYPGSIFTDKRQLICEYICRINYGLPYCSFGLNFNTGEFYCKAEVQMDKSDTPFYEIGMNYLSLILALMDQNVIGINKVVYGDVTPMDAIDKI